MRKITFLPLVMVANGVTGMIDSHYKPKELSFEEASTLLLSDDPELALVHADMAAWHQAHPCNCHAMCTCREYEDKDE